MSSSDEDPPCDDVEEHGQSLSKYLKRKRISSSADTSCDGSDLRDVDETPSLPLSLGEKNYYHLLQFCFCIFIFGVNLWVIYIFLRRILYINTVWARCETFKFNLFLT